MTKEEFVKGITFLGLAYNKDFDQQTVGVWYTFFQNDTFDDFRNAITRLITKSRFLPAISDIRAELAEIQHPDLQLTAEEAWERVLVAVRRYGFYGASEAVQTFNATTQKALRYLGGFTAICTSDAGEWTRKNFINIYNDLQNREIDAYRMPVLTHSERLRLEEFK